MAGSKRPSSSGESKTSKKKTRRLPAQCPICKKVFKDGTVKRHVKSIHKDILANDSNLQDSIRQHGAFKMRELSSESEDDGDARADPCFADSLGEALKLIDSHPVRQLLMWPSNLVNDLPNLRNLSDRELQLYGTEAIDRPRIVDLGPFGKQFGFTMESLVTATAMRYATGGDERKKLKGGFKLANEETRDLDFDNVKQFLSGVLAETLHIPASVIFNLDATGTGEVAEYVAIARAFVKNEYGMEHDTLEEVNEYNITPTFSTFHVHYDEAPSIASALVLQQLTNEMAKLWLFWPRSMAAELCRETPEGSNRTVELLAHEIKPAFLIQESGETVMVPPYTPHATFTLRSCVLIGHAFKCPRAAWLPDIRADVAECVKGDGKTKAELRQKIIDRVGAVILQQESQGELARAVKWLKEQGLFGNSFMREDRRAFKKYCELWAQAIGEHHHCFICKHDHNELRTELLEDAVAHATGHMMNTSKLGLRTKASRKLKAEMEREDEDAVLDAPELVGPEDQYVEKVSQSGEVSATAGASDVETSHSEAGQKRSKKMKPTKLATPGVSGLLSRAAPSDED